MGTRCTADTEQYVILSNGNILHRYNDLNGIATAFDHGLVGAMEELGALGGIWNLCQSPMINKILELRQLKEVYFIYSFGLP